MNEEQLLEFLYIAPVALIKFDEGGNVKMANPRVAQLFNRYAPAGWQWSRSGRLCAEAPPTVADRRANRLWQCGAGG